MFQYTFAIAITCVYVSNFVGGAGATNRVPRTAYSACTSKGLGGVARETI